MLSFKFLERALLLLQATVHVIASHLRARLCEWDTPTPVIWQEHLHNLTAGILMNQYILVMEWIKYNIMLV